MSQLKYEQPCGCVMVLDELTSRWFTQWCDQHIIKQRTLSSVAEQVRILGLAKAAHRLRYKPPVLRRTNSPAYAPFRRDALTPVLGGFDL
jgi:hypothetical protein